MATIITLSSSDSGATSRTTINSNFTNLNATSGVWTKETPSGLINGANLTYTLLHTPLASSGTLTVGGQIYTEGVDYSYSGTTLTLVTALPGGYTGAFIFHYQY